MGTSRWARTSLPAQIAAEQAPSAVSTAKINPDKS
jgi:hypothetical protein